MGSLDLRISDVNWGLQPTPSPLNGERAGVRGEKAKSFEFPKVRFMERTDLQLSDAHWGLEPIFLVLVLVPRPRKLFFAGRSPQLAHSIKAVRPPDRIWVSEFDRLAGAQDIGGAGNRLPAALAEPFAIGPLQRVVVTGLA